MTNCEHLIENALMSIDKAKEKGIDIYEAFLNEMKYKHNQIMLNEVSLTKDELWEIAQYIMFVHDVYKNDIEIETEDPDWEFK